MGFFLVALVVVADGNIFVLPYIVLFILFNLVLIFVSDPKNVCRPYEKFAETSPDNRNLVVMILGTFPLYS